MTERSVKRLRISKDLSLPPEDFLESALGVIGKRGGGKSGGVKVVMEELHKVGLPFIAFDPVGVMWGIKSSLDGKAEGLPVLVIGGSHGDIRLDRRAGAQVATAIVQANVSCIIDFSEEPKAAYREFVKDFAHKLYAVNDTPRLVVLEEAPELVPQKLRPDMTAVFEAVERLVSRGRNKGIGVVMVSQRAATINKDVLTQVDALMLFGSVSPQDRKALKEWVVAWDQQGRAKQFEEGLAGLQRQEAWFWAPTLFKKDGIFQKIRIRDFTTFHPDKTHLRRAGLLKQKPVTTDVSKIIAKFGTQLDKLAEDKVDAASVPKLQARIRQLEKSLESKTNSTSQRTSATKSKVEEQLKRARQLKEENERRARQLISVTRKLKATVHNHKKSVESLLRVSEEIQQLHDSPSKTSYPPYHTEPARRVIAPQNDLEVGEVVLKKGAVKMLRELASRHPLTLTRNQLGTLAGYTASGGTFSSYFSNLKRAGFLEEDSAKNVRVTEAGLEFVGEVPPAPSTHEEIMEMWKRNLKAGAGRMLQVLVDNHPHSVSRADLANFSGFEVSGGTFSSYLSVLRRNNLIKVEGDEISAAEVLFP